MKYILPLLAIVFFALISSCKPKEINNNETIEVLEEFSGLQTLIDAKDHEVTVLNFWSTTCAPCIKEMPHFNELATEYLDKGVKVILVNLEDKKRLESHILPFVKKHALIPEVLLLTDQNYHIWTDEISKTWYGALPATLVMKGDKRNFKFGAYKTYEELQADVELILGQN